MAVVSANMAPATVSVPLAFRPHYRSHHQNIETAVASAVLHRAGESVILLSQNKLSGGLHSPSTHTRERVSNLCVRTVPYDASEYQTYA